MNANKRVSNEAICYICIIFSSLLKRPLPTPSMLLCPKQFSSIPVQVLISGHQTIWLKDIVLPRCLSPGHHLSLLSTSWCSLQLYNLYVSTLRSDLCTDVFQSSLVPDFNGRLHLRETANTFPSAFLWQPLRFYFKNLFN